MAHRTHRGVGSAGSKESSGARPTVTVVLVPGPDGGEALRALDRLVPRCRDLGLEVRVLQSDESLSRELGPRFPEVRWLTVAAGAPEQERREAGMAATATDIVVFVEPSEIDGNGWIADLELRAGISRARSREPSLEWSILLAQRGVPGAIGDR